MDEHNINIPACTEEGGRWWVRDETLVAAGEKPWVHWDSYRPANAPLVCTLKPGTYTIGAGAPDWFRLHVTIGPDGRVPTETAPCQTRGCEGSFEFSSINSVSVDDRFCKECKECQHARG